MILADNTMSMSAVKSPVTFFLIKPDAVLDGLIGKMISIIEDAGFEINLIRKQDAISEWSLREHYAEHRDKPFFEGMIQGMKLKPAVLVAASLKSSFSVDSTNLEAKTIQAGRNAVLIARTQELSTDTMKAKYENRLHASDSIDAAMRELKIWFPYN